MKNIKYLLLGILFGFILCKAEAVSWWRMQEMFRFDGWKMFGIFATAIPTGIISIWLINRFRIKTTEGEDVVIPKKQFNRGYVYGGVIFGIGWAITGACPGPLLANIGAGYSVVIVIFLSAIAGTWVYCFFKERLPH